MKGVILDRDSLGSDMDLSPITGTLDHWDIYPSTKKSDIIERCQDASVILSNKVFLGRETMLACPQLKFISILATGTNNVDINAAKDLGITVSNARNYSTESVVQHTLQLMLALVSNINDYQLAARDGRWSGSPFFCYLNRPIQSIHNLTLGIIGFGSQGKRLKTIAEALGMTVLVSMRANLEDSLDQSGLRTPFKEVLERSDIISLHCPLTEDTENLIGQREFKIMKPSAVIVNCARGGIINEQDLSEALDHDMIAGAALDVLREEPPPRDHPLLLNGHPNLIVSPHVAWASTESRQQLICQTKDNIEAFLANEPQNQCY